MNEFHFMHICDYAMVAEGSQNLSVIGIFDTIHSTAFPAAHPRFSVVAVLTIATENQNAEIIIKDEKQTVAKARIAIRLGKNRLIANFINVVFPHEGVYTVELSIRDQVVGTASLTLKKS